MVISIYFVTKKVMPINELSHIQRLSNKQREPDV